MSRDDLYAVSRETVSPFVFDEQVASVFPDMIRRSVPGYDLILQALPWLAGRVVQAGSRVYDLGCSLGASSQAAREGIRVEGVRIIAVDTSEAMIRRAGERLAAFRSHVPVDLLQADVRDVRIEEASLVILNFTLQFIPLEHRLDLLRRIHQGMRPGGVLVVSEKIAVDDPLMDALVTELHHDFKRAQGYSELEVAQKRQSLESVLLPESIATHRLRLREAGFVSCETWLQHTRFVSLLAMA